MAVSIGNGKREMRPILTSQAPQMTTLSKQLKAFTTTLLCIALRLVLAAELKRQSSSLQQLRSVLHSGNK